MGNRGGRPAKTDVTATKHVRIFSDVAAMLTWIGEVKRVSTAQYLDPIIRHQVVSDFMEIYPSIVKIKEAQDAARLATGQEPTEPLPIVQGLNAPLPSGAPGEFSSTDPIDPRGAKPVPQSKPAPKKQKGK